jgi:hypothetical protein
VWVGLGEHCQAFVGDARAGQDDHLGAKTEFTQQLQPAIVGWGVVLEVERDGIYVCSTELSEGSQRHANEGIDARTLTAKHCFHLVNGRTEMVINATAADSLLGERNTSVE